MKNIARITTLCILIAAACAVVSAQRVAILTPERSDRDLSLASDLAATIAASIKVIDAGLADVAFRSVSLADPFNMSIEEARAVANVIGCDYFIIVRSNGHRRSSLSKPDYFESFAFIYLVNGRNGSLLSWTRLSFEAKDQHSADAQLSASMAQAADNLKPDIKPRETDTTHFHEPIEEVPAEGSSAGPGSIWSWRLRRRYAK